MSSYTALSGLNAAQTDIAVTSNNIANVGTIGFHGSRSEFADVFAHPPYSVSDTQIGMGAELSRISVDYSQGSVTATGNALDLSLQGSGFFQVETGAVEGDGLAYTRAGAFNLNADGYVTNARNNYLTVFPTSETGDALTTTETRRLVIPQTYGSATATTTVDMSARMSLDDNGGKGTQATVPAAAFDPADSSTFAFSSPMPVLDETGTAVPAQVYFVMTKEPDTADPSIAYEAQIVVDGEIATPTAASAVLSFDGDGVMTAGDTDVSYTLPSGTLSLNLAGSTVEHTSFAVNSVTQDGTTEKALSAVKVNDDGTIWASYGSEYQVALGQVAIANFADLQGLSSIGGTTYMATNTSGAPRLGEPGTSGFGTVRSGALENANVDLTKELVNLITSQRNYQASAKALEADAKLADTVINMRS